MNISLPADLRKWVDEEVKEGGYGTASEYIRDMLRRARDRKTRRQIDDMLREAVAAGATEVMDDADFAAILQEARQKLKASKARDRAA